LTIERVNAKAKSEATAEALVLHSQRAIGPLILLLQHLDSDTVKLHLSPLLQDPKPRFTREQLAALLKDLMDAGLSIEDL
jgi:hypothetical protein